MAFDISAEEIRRAAEPLGLSINDQQAEQLRKYAQLLVKWNGVYNLTSIKKAEDVLTLHLLDSLSMVASFNNFAADARVVLDVGSGGGLPAIPLAVMRPDIDVTMVDAVQKKVIFLRQATIALGLKNAHAVHDRIEKLRLDGVDVVTSRAFASLQDMVSWTRHLVKPDGMWLAMKGKFPSDEIAALPEDVEVVKTEQLSVPNGDFERHLIGIRFK